MSYKIIKLNIQGMHCRSCEILLESSISKVEGVDKVRAKFKSGLVEVQYSNNQPDSEILRQVVESNGYRLGKEDKKSFLSKNINDYIDLVMAGAIFFLIYFGLNLLGVFDFNFAVSGAPSFPTVFLVGLTAGVSTCMALVGGLLLGLSARQAEIHPESTRWQKFKPHLFFNLGRLMFYALLGGLIGLVGSVLRLSSSLLGGLTIVVGIVMLLLGLKLIEIFPRLSNTSFVLPKGISRIFGLHQESKEYSHRGSFITGGLTFFLPCGFTQSMQLYAVSTGSFSQGALIMFLFALGTTPGLLGIGGLTSSVKGVFARYFFRLAGLVVIILAWVNISSGYNLLGFTPISFQNNTSTDLNQTLTGGNTSAVVNVKTEGGKQIAIMEQNRSGYQPNSFVVKKGVPVKWVINSTNNYSCASYLVIPSLGISKALSLGENIIEFTPTEVGEIRFTCSMGMYSGFFRVIN